MKVNKPKSGLKKFFLVIFLSALIFYTMVEITNRNTQQMTIRQKFLKTVYPVLMWFGDKTKKGKKELANDSAVPAVPFYSLQVAANDGTVFSFEKLRGKKVLLVNTASNCGYTGQYDDLQKLSEKYKDKLVVIGFPANDFKEQEKGTDTEIAEFCRLNFGVEFPLMKKSSVVKGPQQNPVFNWLTDPAQNGWNRKQPSWNFCKYLVDENGKLTNYFDSSVEPLGDAMKNALRN